MEEPQFEGDTAPEPENAVVAKAADLDLDNADKPVLGGNVVLEVVVDIVEEVQGHLYVVIVN